MAAGVTGASHFWQGSCKEGHGFQFEFRIDNTVVADISPIMDRVVMEFYGCQGSVMAVR